MQTPREKRDAELRAHAERKGAGRHMLEREFLGRLGANAPADKSNEWIIRKILEKQFPGE